MHYLAWLLGISLVFGLAERLWPARPCQSPRREQLWNDLFYLLFNGHVYALVAGALVGLVAAQTRKALALAGLVPERGWLDGWPFLAQFVVFLVASDFLQWCVHRLLHRVPWLWRLHKLHHSIHVMDWAGNFRFHWGEIVVYRSLLYMPLLWLGVTAEVLFAVAVFATAWGHLNHSNVSLALGPFGYVLNGPRMHLWHHDASDEGGLAKNFGIVFSLWDYLLGTAYWPRERAPARLGYPGDEQMPRGLLGQLFFPFVPAQRAAAAQEPGEPVRRAYSRLAERYDRRWSAYVGASVHETLRRLPIGLDQRVLDLGCGTGALSAGLASLLHPRQVVGVDLCPEMLGVARRKLHANLPLLAGDAEHLPFRAGVFDLVVSSSSFHYWRHPEQGLAEIRRVLAPGGTVVITDWCDDYLLCRLLDAALRLVNPAHHRAYGSASCRALLEAAGFEVERLDRYKINWLWGLMTARALLPGRAAPAILPVPALAQEPVVRPIPVTILGGSDRSRPGVRRGFAP